MRKGSNILTKQTLDLEEKRPLKQDELKAGAELLKRQGVKLPTLFGKK